MAKKKNKPADEPIENPDDESEEGEIPEPPPILQGPFNFDEDLDDESVDDEPRSILITGANGNIGRKLAAALEVDYELLLLDSVVVGRDNIIIADFSYFDDDWFEYFENVDTVIHLAGNANESASWEELEKSNLDVMANVLCACALGGVERVIFASSNHVMGGYRELGDMPITGDLPPRPSNAYGASKLMGERLGKSFAEAFDTTFISLRLGWCQKGLNRPDTLPDDWARTLWLSNDDMIRLFECAIEADVGDQNFVVVNGLSNNRGTRWDLTRTAELLGYMPEDDAYAVEL